MENRLLLPHSCKRIGWLLLIPALVAGVMLAFFEFEAEWLEVPVFHIFIQGFMEEDSWFVWKDTNVTNTVVMVVLVVGGLLVGFSREKTEDEFIASLRLRAMLWAVWVHYILLLMAAILTYYFAFFTAMVYLMFTVLLLFIIRFHYLLYHHTKTATDEE